MKQINKIGALAMALGLAGAAQAAVDPGELTVGGQVKTPACVVTLSGNGVFAYGLMSSSLLPVTGHLALEKKTQTLSVDCGAGTTYLSFWPTDNRDGTASGLDSHGHVDGAYGLGRMEGRPDSKVGYYTLLVTNAKVDGRSVLPAAYSVTRRDVYGIDPQVLRHKAGYYNELAMSWGSTAGYADLSKLVSGSHFEMDIEVRPYLASGSVVGGGEPVTEKVDMDGSTTLTFKFGL